MPSRPQRLTAEILKQGPNPYVRVPPAVSTAFANGLAVAHAVAPYVVEDMRWVSLKSHTISSGSDPRAAISQEGRDDSRPPAPGTGIAPTNGYDAKSEAPYHRGPALPATSGGRTTRHRLSGALCRRPSVSPTRHRLRPAHQRVQVPPSPARAARDQLIGRARGRIDLRAGHNPQQPNLRASQTGAPAGEVGVGICEALRAVFHGWIVYSSRTIPPAIGVADLSVNR